MTNCFEKKKSQNFIIDKTCFVKGFSLDRTYKKISNFLVFFLILENRKK